MHNPLEVALAALIEESARAEAVLAERVTLDAGGAALAVLFGDRPAVPVEPSSGPETPPAPEPIDWTEIDAAIEARRSVEAFSPSAPSTATPTPDAAPASSEPTADEALLAALNAPTEGA